MRSGQPDVVGGQPGATYWDQRRAWDREVKEALEIIVAPVVVQQAGVLLLDLHASAFHRAVPATANGPTMALGVGWQGGTVTDIVFAPIPLPAGQTIWKIVFNTRGDVTVQAACTVRAASLAGVDTGLFGTNTALAATNQSLVLSGVALIAGAHPNGTLYLTANFPGTPGSTLALRSVQLYS